MCRRVTDSYSWVEVEILLAEAVASMEIGDADRADAVVRRAIAGAAKASMDGLLDRGVQLLASTSSQPA
jgi:hypothetical protein